MKYRYREHIRDFFKIQITWKPSDALIQIDRKSIVCKLIAQKLLLYLSIYFDVIFTRLSVFADISFDFYIGFDYLAVLILARSGFQIWILKWIHLI